MIAGDDLVNDTAYLADKCRRLARDASDPDVRRMWALAQEHYENAGAWAVKASTAAPPIQHGP